MAVNVPVAFHKALRPRAIVVFTVLAVDPEGRLPGALAAFGERLTAVQYVSRPVPVPGGHLMLVDLENASKRVLRAIPDWLVEELTAAGIAEAVVELPPPMGERYYDVWAFAPAARAFLVPPVAWPPHEGPPHDGVPLDLLDAALAWLRDQAGPEEPPFAQALGVEIPLTWETAREVGAGVLRSGQTTSVTLVTDFATSVAGAVVSNGPVSNGPVSNGPVSNGPVSNGRHGVNPRASVTAAGADWAPGAVAERMRGQREAIRRYPHPLGWAGVTAEADAQWTMLEDWVERPEDRTSREEFRRLPELASDVLVPDAMWYQVLSAGHLERLGGPPQGAVPLRDGGYELTIGDPEQWLPGHPDRYRVRDRGRELLAGCLGTEEAAHEVRRARMC
jgi:hypothetical protein